MRHCFFLYLRATDAMQNALAFESATRRAIASLQFRKLQSEIVETREAAKAKAQKAAYWLHKRKVEHAQGCILKHKSVSPPNPPTFTAIRFFDAYLVLVFLPQEPINLKRNRLRLRQRSIYSIKSIFTVKFLKCKIYMSSIFYMFMY